MMIKWRRFLALLLVMCSTAVWAAEREALPPVNSRINDHAGVLSNSQMHLLYQLLAQYDFATRHYVVVLTAVTAGGDSPQAYAERVWQAWPSQKRPRAALLLLLREERRAAIVAGEELGKILDVATIKQLLTGEIDVALRRGDFDGAAMEGVKAIMGVLSR
ncbi:MAG: TPM domain-containing protein [Gammaproteobacteria bacterium]|nr:TPM domain-containing protein [Gammaproteobacteria bacterium]